LNISVNELVFRKVYTVDMISTIFNEGTNHLTFKSTFHNARNVFEFDSEIKIMAVPGTNQY